MFNLLRRCSSRKCRLHCSDSSLRQYSACLCISLICLATLLTVSATGVLSRSQINFPQLTNTSSSWEKISCVSFSIPSPRLDDSVSIPERSPARTFENSLYASTESFCDDQVRWPPSVVAPRLGHLHLSLDYRSLKFATLVFWPPFPPSLTANLPPATDVDSIWPSPFLRCPILSP
ncbi:hypothetical protein TTRE_0000800901 [Trichuris trichiura]|uniref:Uncharacterized protein n=1 Tax=Trichuris trichiura TaxID=36087 RepID=A0A077ZHA6_TRITR|nr:hypothetical protein TTRE_0000800901 [Trichuris trichiura]